MKQGKQSVEAYALELESVRDPQQTLPMILPLDVYPASVEPSAIMWQDGMRTLSYNIKKDEGIIVKHIFTCNLVRLQEEPTSLFRDFQTDVELRRQGGDSAGGGVFRFNSIHMLTLLCRLFLVPGWGGTRWFVHRYCWVEGCAGVCIPSA